MGRTIPNTPGFRALQLIRGGSYTVTIPKWWVDKYGLCKGVRLFTLEDGYSLRFVVGDQKKGKRVASLDIDNLSDMRSIRYSILTYYMQGADEIIVSSRDIIPSERKKKLREIRLELPGVDIVYEDSNRVVFQVLVDMREEKLDDIVLTIHEMALTAHRDSIKALTHGSMGQAEELIGREGEMLRVYRKLIRQLALCSCNPRLAYSSGVKDTRELITYALL